MECSQNPIMVAATVTLYENFLEEKCESDLLIPDYYPAAEKIIQCSAESVITKKEIEGDRLDLEGICRICVIYQAEEEGGVKALHESVSFRESLQIKEPGEHPWVQTIVRTTGATCRLLNSRKISVKANVSVALKVKDQRFTPIIEKMDCQLAESLLMPISVYTVLEQPADTVKVQGEMELHNAVQDVLKTDGFVCLKSMKMIPGKAVIKGVLNLFALYTLENAPNRIESASTAVPFTQVLDLRQNEERGEMDAVASIQNLRTDVESDENGQNRIISISATLLTEGEIYENQSHSILLDAYSNRYPIELSKFMIRPEELCEHLENIETVHHKIPMDSNDLEIIQAVGVPVIRKISGRDKILSMEGILDVSLFLREGQNYRSTEKSLTFTLTAPLNHLDGQMRCEVNPCVLAISCAVGADGIELKTDIAYSMTTFARREYEVIKEINLDTDHPLEHGDQSPLIVYYAEKGERLWDIARRYATSVSSLKAANDLVGDSLDEKKLLLISRA